jgi:para-aminobenzoate synthetase component 1
MLPAGSICGAPKAKTVSIIQEVEQGPRGYYTGIFGYFNGETLDSGVNIRYIEKNDGRLLYRSGGGITFLSNQESEYKELIEKIYVPII